MDTICDVEYASDRCYCAPALDGNIPLGAATVILSGLPMLLGILSCRIHSVIYIHLKLIIYPRAYLSYKRVNMICFPCHDILYKIRLKNVEMKLVHENANDSSRKEFSGKRSKNISYTRQILTAARRATTPANIRPDTPRVRNSITCTTRPSLGYR